ncbi:helix-turn-helix domain-containing protein [Agrobacterium sp. FDAARGOS_525]|uniref:helix-turn-helix domain-containing protein n=1 Tax=Agrobacterium sp. FDAARGOS_525 TaxID=2420311 RepID=UPI002680BA29
MNPIKFIRTHILKVNQAELGKIINSAQAAVSRLETGEVSPNLEQIRLIRGEVKRRALSWDNEWLFGAIPEDAQNNRRIRS